MPPKVTLKDIAREANVSVGLTSKALTGYAEVSEATQQRIRRISTRLGYRPPRRRAAQRQAGDAQPRLRRAGLIFLDNRNSTTAYAQHWVREFSLASRHRDIRMEVTVLEFDHDLSSCGDDLRRHAEDVDGVLIFGYVQARALPILRSLGKPCVAIGDFEHGPRPVEHQVNIDKREMGYAATRALLDAGHRRIGFFATHAWPGGWYDQWLTGYRLALMQAGIDHDPAVCALFDRGDTTVIGEQAATHMMVADPRPTAFVAPAVALAVAFRHAMASRGVTLGPRQMVVGGDPQEAERFGLGDYPLFSEDVRSAAAHALDLLQRLAQREPVPPAQIMVPCQVHNLDHLCGKDHVCPE